MVARYEGGEPDPELIRKLKKPVRDGYIIADFTVIDLGNERVEIDLEDEITVIASPDSQQLPSLPHFRS